MTVRELRSMLKTMPNDAVVNIAFDPLDFDAVTATCADVATVSVMSTGDGNIVVLEPAGNNPA